MKETHPFGNFVPKNARYLILGSFAGRKVPGYDWFYSNSRNHFWPIIEVVYGQKLPSIEDRQKLFTKLDLAISDVILECERRAPNNADTSLRNIIPNTRAVNLILSKNKIDTIFFSSRFAERLFRKYMKNLIGQYPKVRLVTLPSPSPRYAKMSKTEKVLRYKELLPVLN